MQVFETPDLVHYKLNCNCGSDDHISTIEIEVDKEFHDMNLNFYKKMVWTSHWGDIPWYQRIWKRLTCSIKVLFTGWVELEESVLIYGEDNINSFIEALEEGKQIIKKGLEDGTSKEV